MSFGAKKRKKKADKRIVKLWKHHPSFLTAQALHQASRDVDKCIQNSSRLLDVVNVQGCSFVEPASLHTVQLRDMTFGRLI